MIAGSRIANLLVESTSSHSLQFWWLGHYTSGLPQFGGVAHQYILERKMIEQEVQ